MHKQMNPYEPPAATPSLQLQASTPLNWQAIVIAVAICFGVGLVVGFGWGLMAMVFALAVGPSAVTYFENPIFMVAGFTVGFVPSIAGALYLGSQIQSRWLVHAMIYSAANFLISIPFMLIPSEIETSWTDVGYCVLLIPVSIVSVWYTRRR